MDLEYDTLGRIWNFDLLPRGLIAGVKPVLKLSSPRKARAFWIDTRVQ